MTQAIPIAPVFSVRSNLTNLNKNEKHVYVFLSFLICLLQLRCLLAGNFVLFM